MVHLIWIYCSITVIVIIFFVMPMTVWTQFVTSRSLFAPYKVKNKFWLVFLLTAWDNMFGIKKREEEVYFSTSQTKYWNVKEQKVYFLGGIRILSTILVLELKNEDDEDFAAKRNGKVGIFFVLTMITMTVWGSTSPVFASTDTSKPETSQFFLFDYCHKTNFMFRRIKHCMLGHTHSTDQFFSIRLVEHFKNPGKQLHACLLFACKHPTGIDEAVQLKLWTTMLLAHSTWYMATFSCKPFSKLNEALKIVGLFPVQIIGSV